MPAWPWWGGADEAVWLLRLVDLVLFVSAVELGWLCWRGPVGQRVALLHNLLAGAALALALRLGLSGAGLWGVAPCLAAAGLAHGLDLRSRLKRHRWTGAIPAGVRATAPAGPPGPHRPLSTSAGTRP